MEITISTIINVVGYVTSIISLGAYLKAKIDNLTEQVKKQNGSISKLQEYNLDHLREYYHEKGQ